MIYDLLSNLESYRALAPEATEKLSAILPTLNKNSESGKTILIENKLLIIVQRYATNAVAAGKLETHREFADIQLLLDGREKIGYAPAEVLTVTREYDAENDYALYQCPEADITFAPLSAGNFVVYLPGEAHMPGRGDGSEVVKVVVKIHKSLLK